MTKFLFSIILFISMPAFADRLELSDGRWVDESGEIHNEKFENENVLAPWNNTLYKDDPLAPWNNTIYKDDPLAPWNNSFSTESDTNSYLRENGESDSDYYWD